MNRATLLTLFVESVARQDSARTTIEAVLRGDDNDMEDLSLATLDFVTEASIQDKLEDLYYSATGGGLIREDSEYWR